MHRVRVYPGSGVLTWVQSLLLVLGNNGIDRKESEFILGSTSESSLELDGWHTETKIWLHAAMLWACFGRHGWQCNCHEHGNTGCLDEHVDD